ncbi:MAG: helix-turn-helix domain-containing protein [Symbiobacteriaceae bacterium]
MSLSVGEALRAARSQAGLTLRQAAGRLKADEATLSRYERGKVEPPLEIIAAATREYRSPLPMLAYLERALRVFREFAGAA